MFQQIDFPYHYHLHTPAHQLKEIFYLLHFHYNNCQISFSIACRQQECTPFEAGAICLTNPSYQPDMYTPAFPHLNIFSEFIISVFSFVNKSILTTPSFKNQVRCTWSTLCMLIILSNNSSHPTRLSVFARVRSSYSNRQIEIYIPIYPHPCITHETSALDFYSFVIINLVICSSL